MQHDTLEKHVRSIMVATDNPENQEQNIETPPDGIQDVYVFIVREREEAEDATFTVESIPLHSQKTSLLPAYTICGIYIMCILAICAFQVYCLLNPPVATITIIPKIQHVTLSGTMQLGRPLNPITFSQSQTAQTTGYGHQPAAKATGTITFYNGQFQTVFIAAGTILTDANGQAIVTDQDAAIPAGNPPSYGQVAVSAHAVNPGARGNIPAYDINLACCTASVFAKNTEAFTGGQNERDFPTVRQEDIYKVSTPLKKSLAQSITGAFQGQLKPGELVFIIPCTPVVSSDHRPGDEAATVKVTVSQTCSAIAYNSQTLEEKGAAFLAAQALQKTGAGYSLFGTVHVSVTQASVTSTPHPLVFLSFQATGAWIYGLSQTEEQHIKELIAGKTSEEALQQLASLPGVERITISFHGFGDNTRLPKNTGYMHIVLIVQ